MHYKFVELEDEVATLTGRFNKCCMSYGLSVCRPPLSLLFARPARLTSRPQSANALWPVPNYRHVYVCVRESFHDDEKSNPRPLDGEPDTHRHPVL